MKVITLKKKDLEERIGRIKAESENGVQLLKNVFLHLYGVNLDAEGEEESIKPWDYQISEKLALELMEYSIDVLGDQPFDINMLWLNYSPSSKSSLKREQIGTVAGVRG